MLRGRGQAEAGAAPQAPPRRDAPGIGATEAAGPRTAPPTPAPPSGRSLAPVCAPPSPLRRRRAPGSTRRPRRAGGGDGASRRGRQRGATLTVQVVLQVHSGRHLRRPLSGSACGRCLVGRGGALLTIHEPHVPIGPRRGRVHTGPPLNFRRARGGASGILESSWPRAVGVSGCPGPGLTPIPHAQAAARALVPTPPRQPGGSQPGHRALKPRPQIPSRPRGPSRRPCAPGRHFAAVSPRGGACGSLVAVASAAPRLQTCGEGACIRGALLLLA